MSKILVDTIDTRSGTSNITIGSSNASQITLKSGATLTNFPANTPAFHATMSGNQDLPNNTATKVDFDTEVFDTDSDYDTTNKRFLPTVSGKYFITFSMSLSSGASIGGVEVKLRKNGTDVYITEQAHYYGNAAQTYVISGIISCNGSSDYIEAFAEQDRGSTAPIQGTTTQSFFQGFKLIGA